MPPAGRTTRIAITARHPEPPVRPWPEYVSCSWRGRDCSHLRWQGVQKNRVFPRRHASMVRLPCRLAVLQRPHLNTVWGGLRLGHNDPTSPRMTAAATTPARMVSGLTMHPFCQRFEAQGRRCPAIPATAQVVPGLTLFDGRQIASGRTTVPGPPCDKASQRTPNRPSHAPPRLASLRIRACARPSSTAGSTLGHAWPWPW
jgi:hypothetical protein